MEIVKIGKYKIHNNHSPFIIAEAGVNHNGEIKKALKMIEIAKRSGANAIKFQTFNAEELVSDPNLTYTYTSKGKKITESMLTMFKRYELSEDQWYMIKKKCDKENILFLSSPSSDPDLKLLLELKIPAIKAGSDDLTNLPLLKKFSSTGLPLILSCGMSNLEEIKTTYNFISKKNDYPIILLLTTSEYPTPPKDVNLLKLKILQKEFCAPIGFSDHTQGILASSLAVSFGACVFEKHFTLDHNLPGPDHWFSEDPLGLQDWIKSIRTSYTMMGKETITPTKGEEKIKKLARKSVIALFDIKKNEILDSKNIGLKRPGNGLSSKYYYDMLGKRATRNLAKNRLLKLGDFK